jgi:hypothetical protein
MNNILPYKRPESNLQCTTFGIRLDLSCKTTVIKPLQIITKGNELQIQACIHLIVNDLL